jgi:hypothetical protein
MNSRLKVFGIVALLGFVAGIIAQLTADYVIPWLMEVLPQLINIKWIIAGFAGAILTVLLVMAWAYVSGNKDRY